MKINRDFFKNKYLEDFKITQKICFAILANSYINGDVKLDKNGEEMFGQKDNTGNVVFYKRSDGQKVVVFSFKSLSRLLEITSVTARKYVNDFIKRGLVEIISRDNGVYFVKITKRGEEVFV